MKKMTDEELRRLAPQPLWYYAVMWTIILLGVAALLLIGILAG